MTQLEAISKIEKLIADGGGYSSPTIYDEYYSAISFLRHQLPTHCFEKIKETETWLNIYYSPQKYKKYTGGLPQIKIWILTSLSVLRSHADQ
jgi:hypothetical protein